MWLMPADRTVRAGSPVRFARYDRMHSRLGNHAADARKRNVVRWHRGVFHVKQKVRLGWIELSHRMRAFGIVGADGGSL